MVLRQRDHASEVVTPGASQSLPARYIRLPLTMQSRRALNGHPKIKRPDGVFGIPGLDETCLNLWGEAIDRLSDELWG